MRIHAKRCQTYSRIGLLVSLFSLLAIHLVAAEHTPNVIFILLDDQGWADAGALGHPYMKTPNIDRLVAEGTRFNQFYVCNPVCSPSRTAFMTGHFPVRHGVHQHFATHEQNAQRGMPNWLDPDVTTVCDLLRTAGYATAHFGKWHLGSGTDAPDPSAYGIDVHRTVNSAGPGWAARERERYFRAHSTDLMVEEAIQFIRDHRDRPFYLNLWTLVPHALLDPTPDELAVYADLRVQAEDFSSWMRDYVSAARDPSGQMKIFCAAMTGLDQAIGRLLDTLDAEDLTRDTIVFFSSDNGPEDYHIGNAANAGMGSPGALRARKRSLYEGGIRTPLLVRWPGRIKAGRVDDQVVLTAVDFLPTVARLANVPVPDLALDGEDVSDILLGNSRPRSKPIFWEWRGGVAGDPDYRPPRLAIRQGDWKLFCQMDGAETQLFNIPQDPEERQDCVTEHPAVVESLKSQLLQWHRSLPEGPLQETPRSRSR